MEIVTIYSREILFEGKQQAKLQEVTNYKYNSKADSTTPPAAGTVKSQLFYNTIFNRLFYCFHIFCQGFL